MKRVWIIITMMAMLCLTAFAHSGQLVSINGYTMMPLDTFGDTFNADIDYDGRYNALSITVGYHTVDLIPYSTTAWVDGHPVHLNASVVIIDGVTYVPVEFLTDVFGIYRSYRDTSCLFYDPYIGLQIVFVLDNDWGRLHHDWRYTYDCRTYGGFRHRDVHISSGFPTQTPSPLIAHGRMNNRDRERDRDRDRNNNRMLQHDQYWWFGTPRDPRMGRDSRSNSDDRWNRRDSTPRHEEMSRAPKRHEDRGAQRDEDHDRGHGHGDRHRD